MGRPQPVEARHVKFALDVGNEEKSRIELSRNWFTGEMHILVNGDRVAGQSLLALSTYCSLSLKRRYEFSVGTSEKHDVAIERERRLIAGGVRPQTYRVFVDGRLVHEQSGY